MQAASCFTRCATKKILLKAEVDLGDYLSEDAIAQIDLFDRLQLQSVIAVCRASTTLSDAGRKLFDQSRQQKAVVNDADRLRKFLHKFGLNWEQLKQSY